MDAKTTIKIGPYSRGGCRHCHLQAADHDFEPASLLKLFGINIPALDENYMYFTKSHILHGVNLEVGRGEIVSLLGRNGVGRSTTSYNFV